MSFTMSILCPLVCPIVVMYLPLLWSALLGGSGSSRQPSGHMMQPSQIQPHPHLQSQQQRLVHQQPVRNYCYHFNLVRVICTFLYFDLNISSLILCLLF